MNNDELYMYDEWPRNDSIKILADASPKELENNNDDDTNDVFYQRKVANLSINTSKIQETVNELLKPACYSGKMLEFLDNTENINDSVIRKKQKQSRISIFDSFYPPLRTESHQERRDSVAVANYGERKFLLDIKSSKTPSKAIPKDILKSKRSSLGSVNKIIRFTTPFKSNGFQTTKIDNKIPMFDKTKIKSRIGHILRKKHISTEGDDSKDLLQIYRKEGQTTKKNYLEKHELELYEKLAMKGGHHLLRAALQIKHEENNQNQLAGDTYATSFNRIQNGLRMLRDHKNTMGIFDKNGNYIQAMDQVENSTNKPKIQNFKGRRANIGNLNNQAKKADQEKSQLYDDERTKNKQKFTYKAKHLRDVLLAKDMVKWKKLRNPGEKLTLSMKSVDIKDTRIGSAQLTTQSQIIMSTRSMNSNVLNNTFEDFGSGHIGLRKMPLIMNIKKDKDKEKDRSMLGKLGLISPKIIEQIFAERKKKLLNQSLKNTNFPIMRNRRKNSPAQITNRHIVSNSSLI